ncbi:MAG: Jag N-terminal domain-containing protein [Clostridia bacterium]|nr:Jag N-terminal domain-containing protein [Clostridia bacterium]
MAEEIIVTGKTFEEAMAAAQSKYSGVNVQYEILEMPKKGFLGIGSTPAKIKVIIEDEEEEDADLSGIVASIKGLGVATNKGGGEEKPKAEKQQKKEKKEEKKAEKKAEKQEKKEKAPKAQKTAPKEKTAPVIKEPRVIEVTDKEKECALNFANTMLRDMGVDAEARFTGSEPSGMGGNTYPHMEIAGEGAGILIGHHGETLDAIQYLVNLCAHRKGGGSSKEFVKIIVDIEDYRAKREETLRSLARRTAAKAQKYKRNVSLEPMNPFERRIIHSEIQGIENVSTHSVGSDENRKIIVCYDGPDKVDRRRRNGGKPQNHTPDATDAELAMEALKNDEAVEE